jgi:hypothetical protein
MMLLGVMLTIFLVPGVLGANITDCDQASLGNDVYLVQNDINMDLDGWCWFVNNDTVVDCQGYTLYHNGSYWFGQTPTVLDNVTIKNCVVDYTNDGDADLSQALWFGSGDTHNFWMENITLKQTQPVNTSFGWGLGAFWVNVSGTNITIKDIEVIGDVNASVLFSFDDLSNNGVWNNVTIHNVSGATTQSYDAIQLLGTGSDIEMYDIDINAGYSPIGIKCDATCSDVVIHDSVLNSTAGYGLTLQNATDFNVYNVEVNASADTSAHGIYMGNCTGNISNSSVLWAGDNGILVSTGSNVSVDNVSIRTDGDSAGIHCDGQCHLTDVDIDTANHGVILQLGGSSGSTVDDVYAQNIGSDAFRSIISNNNTFTNIHAQDIGRGMIIYQSNNTLVQNFTVENATTSNGANSWESNYTRFYNVTINSPNSNAGGIGFGGQTKPSYHGIIDGCNVSHANNGSLFVIGGVNITVTNCEFHHSLTGVFMSKADSFVDYAEDVWIYNNTIHNNTNNFEVGEISLTNINFNSSSYGNTWDDYTGCDNNSDNIGETPYTLNATLGIYDYLPFTLTVCPTAPVDQTAFEEVPILAVIPVVIVAVLLVMMVGSILSGVIDLRILIPMAIMLMVAIAMVGVMYVV